MKSVYQCEICKSTYDSVPLAEVCESEHLRIGSGAIIDARYSSDKQSDNHRYPRSIRVKYGDFIATYWYQDGNYEKGTPVSSVV